MNTPQLNEVLNESKKSNIFMYGFDTSLKKKKCTLFNKNSTNNVILTIICFFNVVLIIFVIDNLFFYNKPHLYKK